MVRVYESDVMEGINDKAIELANKYNVSVELATQAIYIAIADLLVTDDSELISQAIGNLSYIELIRRLNNEYKKSDKSLSRRRYAPQCKTNKVHCR